MFLFFSSHDILHGLTSSYFKAYVCNTDKEAGSILFHDYFDTNFYRKIGHFPLLLNYI